MRQSTQVRVLATKLIPPAALFVVIWANEARAQPYLIPEDAPVFSGMGRDWPVWFESLKPALNRNVVAVQVDDSGGPFPARAIGIRELGDGYVIFGVRSTVMDSAPPLGPSPVPDPPMIGLDGKPQPPFHPPPKPSVAARLEGCEVSLDNKLAGRIVAAFRKVLMQTRYDPDPTSTLQTGIHFAVRDGKFRTLEGRLSRPVQGSQPQLLLHIGFAMAYKSCWKGDNTFGQAVRAEIEGYLDLLG